MGNRLIKRTVALVLASSILALALPTPRRAQAATGRGLGDYEEAIGTYSVDPDMPSYRRYMESHPHDRPSDTYTIGAADYARFEGADGSATPRTYEDYMGGSGTSILTEERGLVEYVVDIGTAGLYDLSILYYPAEGKNTVIQRSFFVDGELPYSELALVEFSRIWVNKVSDYIMDENGLKLRNWARDNQGNDLKPGLEEAPEWVRGHLYDSVGYVTDVLPIYLSEGAHTITIVSMREPMIIGELRLGNTDMVTNYAATKAENDKKGVRDTSGRTIRIEAENADRTSSQMLYPVQDQSSPAVYPSSAKALKNNTIGGNPWRLVGQWIEYDFEVEEDGYYNISLFAKQNFVKGIYVSRKIYIDGAVPFEEMNDYGFRYGQNFRLDTLQDESGDAYKFHLTKGAHTLRMQVVLGEFSTIIGDVQDAVTRLNAIYRKVIRILGVAPDRYRDYQIEASLPELEGELVVVRDILATALANLRASAGRGSNKETVLITMIDQLGDLIRDQEYFTKVLGSFKVNIRACGNWVTGSLEQPLQLDAIYITSPDVRVRVGNNGFLARLVYELRKLFYSFFINYNQIGNVSTKGDGRPTITLWVGTGRDQANVINSLIDETFTGQHGINVNVMLVDMGMLLQATLAGQGPDVAIQVGVDLPMNYGLRHAVADLRQFDDLGEVRGRFNGSAMLPFEYGGRTYGLPETQTFPMMFYRRDILRELGIDPPTTWDEVNVIMTILSKNQMEFGMLPNEQTFAMMLYQNGGQYYVGDGRKSALDSEEAITAFKKYCEYYTDYKLDILTSVEERFRTGEAPLIIADYTIYNNLQVSAPDIMGLWGFTRVPGTVREDGTVDHSVASTGTACVIMDDAGDKAAAWEFLKWWTSADTQTLYGREMESLMGAAARVPTANMEAFGRLPWPVQDYDALAAQFKSVRGIPQVPGGYFTNRNVENAFYRVTVDYDTATPREEIMENILYINDEINFKRAEFGLPLYGE